MTDTPAPAIKVQSPVGSIRSLARSPPEDGVIVSHDLAASKAGATTEGRQTPNGKAFSGKLIRTLSGNPATNTHQNGTEGRRLSGSGPALDPIGRQRTQIRGDSAISDGTVSPTTPSRPEFEKPAQKLDTAAARDTKKNRSSFLSRFITKKKDSFDSVDDADEAGGDKRAEGANAETFSQPIGYMPKYPEPPKYIKVRAKGKKSKDFDRVFLAQELRGRTGVEVAQAGGRKINPAEKAKQGAAVWALEFSQDGRYLAAGGHDHLVRVWAVLDNEEDRIAPENHEATSKDGVTTSLSAPVFKCKPVQEYEGHTSTVVAISWSRNNFLLSSSMDKTVRLWHVSRSQCLMGFKHSDFVTSIQFHPKDDRFFLAGSMDSKMRLWSIPDRAVAHSIQCNEIITSVAFTPDGKTSIAGCLSGVCHFYDTEDFRPQTTMHVRSAHGKNSKGSKITGIQAINNPPSDPNGEVKLLITSNDSRIRLYNFRDKGLEWKLKGAENATSQIKASFSDDGRYIITGSEDKKAYLWSTETQDKAIMGKQDRWPVEMFEAHTSVVTAAVMAPTGTRRLLQQSGDPLFDICNPPPVQLVSRTESRSSINNPNDSRESIDRSSTAMSHAPRPEDNPAWLARSAHPNGNVIVTADFEGHIKVFRQDCAHRQRLRSNENWDSGSTFSKKLHLHRSSSIATRNSVHSARELAMTAHPSDRILTWRQSIDRTPTTLTAGGSTPALPVDSGPATGTRRNFSRSMSPAKSASAALPASSPAMGSTRTGGSTPQVASTPTAAQSESPSLAAKGGASAEASSTNSSQSKLAQFLPRQANAANGNALLISADGTSDALFQRSAFEAQAHAARRESITEASPRRRERLETPARPEHRLSESRSSLMTASSAGLETGSDDIQEETEDDDDDGERCERCGGENFRMKRKGGLRVVECVTCGKVAR